MQESALFPLNLFLLPGDFTQLYIFEERYKQLIKDCREEDITFGIPFSDRLNTRNLGTLVRLHEVLKTYPDGEMDVIIEAVGTFKLEKFYYQMAPKLYPGGQIVPLPRPSDEACGPALAERFRRYLAQHEIYDYDHLPDTDLNLYTVASALHLNDYERMELAQIPTAARVREFLMNYLRYLELLHEQESHVYQNFYLN
ncbi:MAG: hypothetical protein RI842_11240 [Schleiferiaceae bacterium]|nr:hypothetical protein [Schleiferiaceae bacterium]MDR9443281.1 hypothetical protein [Schleiferiaceae bacterium]